MTIQDLITKVSSSDKEMNYIKISYRNHTIHSIGLDEVSVVSNERYNEMKNDKNFSHLEILREATDDEIEKYIFLEKMREKFEDI